MKIYKKVILLGVYILFSCGAACSDMVENLPGGYQFISESKNDQIIRGHGKLISCNIISYEYNRRYILACQEPRTVCFEEPDKLIESVNIIQFWIIDVKIDSLYGPLNIEEYLNLRTRLDIPKDLKIALDI